MERTDVSKLGARERQNYIDNLIRHVQTDDIRLLQKQKDRIDRVKVKQPTIEVRYNNLCVDADCTVVEGKPLPTLWNSFKDFFSTLWVLAGSKPQETKIKILKDVTGIIQPSRLTLLLGPPGSGKTTFLRALSGNLDKSLNVTGEITYNGYTMEEFVPQRTAAYVSQYDLHIPEMTVRETIDFSARCQGVGSRDEIMREVIQKEKEAGIVPDQEIDTYMTGISLKGLKMSIQTDYILKIIALDICSNTIAGDAMRIGISGGQKKRLTTAEMIVGPTKAIFLDEISTGLDTSTTFQIVKHLQQVGHILETTLLISLLQPSPETYELFDDVILMAEGKVVYHGPYSHVVHFFYDCGFKCPERKGTADFLQEVISRKDQKQYWNDSETSYEYVSVDNFCEKFKVCNIGYILEKEILKPFAQSEHHKKALSHSIYSLPKWQLFKACMSRELLLMKRNFFVYIFKTLQLIMEIDERHSTYYMGALFYAILVLVVNGFPELAITVSRLPGFYKQRDLHFYPAWAYSIPATILKIPMSFIDSLGWTSMTYYVIGYSPEIGRFFSHFFLLFALHQTGLALFRFIAALFKEGDKAYFYGSFTFLVLFYFGGFILPKPSLPDWLSWGFWICPLSYAEIDISVNEFLAPRWQKIFPSNVTIAKQVLRSRGLDYPSYFYWISLASLFGFSFLFNVGFGLALTYLRAPGRCRAIISREKLFELERENN
ncbi:ABC transporter G family member [Zostera marina]|uniref:ABC transporter G family member n=1 Tax=Zostera marina TaxID=29655 RepID=A0A0K9PE74_ZOSMR|nr:ABC transporter G family member [Zostera marina]